MPTLKEYGWPERFYAEAARDPDRLPARVVAQHRGLYRIAHAQGECLAEVSGRFQHEAGALTDYPAVGDYVMVTCAGENDRAVIHHVLTRKSVFVRTAVGVTGQAQVVAANIDVAFVCMSLNNNFNLSRLERYLSIAWDSGAKPVVLLTKADLCDELPQRLAEAERAAAFADIVTVSAFDETAGERVLAYAQEGVTASFIGSSGVGKSTLINTLLHAQALSTAQTGRFDKGRHTTTGREMRILGNGGIVIDTPGMRELGVESADLSTAFADIEALEAQCRFADCTHTNEPGCAILSALADGTIDRRRLENYRKLKREAKYDGLSHKRLEAAKANDMFKDVGGMKNVRKYIRQTDKRGEWE